MRSVRITKSYSWWRWWSPIVWRLRPRDERKRGSTGCRQAGTPESQGMIGYYTGRFLQLAGLIIVAETLIMFFGRMMPLLKGSLAGVLDFYLGYFLARKFSA